MGVFLTSLTGHIMGLEKQQNKRKQKQNIKKTQYEQKMVYNTPKTSGKERGKHIYIHAFIFIFSQVTFDVELSVFCSLSLVHTYNQMHTAGKYW